MSGAPHPQPNSRHDDLVVVVSAGQKGLFLGFKRSAPLVVSGAFGMESGVCVLYLFFCAWKVGCCACRVDIWILMFKFMTFAYVNDYQDLQVGTSRMGVQSFPIISLF